MHDKAHDPAREKAVALRVSEHTRKINHILAVVFLILITLYFIGNLLDWGITGLIDSFEVKNEVALSTDQTYAGKSISNLDAFNNHLILKDQAANLLGSSKKLLGNQYHFNNVLTDIYKDQTGRLTYICPYKDTGDYAQNIASFSKHLREKEIPLLYVQAPFKILKDENKLPYGIVDYSNANADRLVASLAQQNVATYDLRNVLVETDRNLDPLFFFTDSRWTPDAAFSAYINVMEYLVTKQGYPRGQEKLFAGYDNFAYNLEENCFIGNQAAVVGQAYLRKKDSFDYFLPYAKTSFEISITRKNGETLLRTGDFASAVMTKPTTGGNLFSSYLAEPSPKIVLKNNQTENTQKVLLLGDDFIGPFASFLSLNFKETHVVNPSLLKESVTDYASQINPDYVIILYNPQSFNDSLFFDFSSK